MESCSLHKYWIWQSLGICFNSLNTSKDLLNCKEQARVHSKWNLIYDWVYAHWVEVSKHPSKGENTKDHLRHTTTVDCAGQWCSATFCWLLSILPRPSTKGYGATMAQSSSLLWNSGKVHIYEKNKIALMFNVQAYQTQNDLTAACLKKDPWSLAVKEVFLTKKLQCAWVCIGVS